MERKKLCKISTADDNNKYYLLTTIKDEGKKGIALVLSDGLVAWSGEIESADLVHTSDKLKMKTEEYLDQTCKALTGEHSGSLTFQYQVKRNGGFAGLSWKKTVSGIKFQLGSVTLTSEKNPSSIIQAMFDYCIESSATQSQEIRTLSANEERLSSERLNALKRLEKCTAVKESLETDLYSKVIINSKKSKLRDLRDELEEVRSGAATQTTSRGNATSKRRLSSSPEPDAGKGSDEDQSDNYNTDDDEPSAKKRRNAVVVPPDADSLIFLDDEEDKEEKTAPLARRQRRQQGSQKKQTPSKPVIPKVSSSKKPSLTRGGSGSSSGSSGARSGRRSATQANADDLMDMM